MTVTFRAPPVLAREPELVLRARYRTAWDDAYASADGQRRVATLVRSSDGTFRGALRLPDSVVFAAFAVEDSGARRVDSRSRALWELLAHGADGRPTYDALRERENDLIGRNMESALAATRQRAALYPEQPDAWATLFGIEQFNLGSLTDSALADHRARLARLSALWSQRDEVPFGVVAGMLDYAGQVTEHDDSLRRAIKDRWKPVLDRGTVGNSLDREAVRARWRQLNSLAMSHPDSARAALALAEQFWTGAGRRDPNGAQMGAQFARLANDSDAARLRWVDRFAASPGGGAYAYAELRTIAALRPAAVSRLTAYAERLLRPDESRRPLEATRREAAAADSDGARGVYALLADVLFAASDTTAAVAALVRATNGGWNTPLARRAGDALLVAGDTNGAFALLARVAVDPGTATMAADSLGTNARRAIGAARWSSALSDAQGVMRSHFAATGVRDPLPKLLQLSDAEGRVTDLSRLSAGRVSVVTFWSRYCGPSRQQLPLLDSLRARLARRGMALVPITVESPTAEVVAFLRESKINVPVYFDWTGVARRAFGQWATPEYYVVDGRGRVRFRHGTLDAVLSQAAIVAEER